MSNDAAEARRRIRSLARWSEGAAGIAFMLFALSLLLLVVVIFAMPEARVELIEAFDDDQLTQAPQIKRQYWPVDRIGADGVISLDAVADAPFAGRVPAR